MDSWEPHSCFLTVKTSYRHCSLHTAAPSAHTTVTPGTLNCTCPQHFPLIFPWDTLNCKLHMSPRFPTHFPLGHSTPHVQIFPTREDFHSQGIIYGQLGIPQLLSPCTNTLQALLFTDSSSTSPQHCDHWDTPYVWPCPPWRLFLRNQACQRRNSLRHTGIQCW